MKFNSTIKLAWLSIKRASPFCLLVWLILVDQQPIIAQKYFGIGFHLTPPVFLENTKNPYVIVRPQIGLAYSITFKKEWMPSKKKQWYAEAGLTTQGLRYHQTNYFGDSLTIWSTSNNLHAGYPSILFGFGQSVKVFKSKGRLSLGLEGTLCIVQDLGAIESASFGITNTPMTDITFPANIRLNVGYSYDFQIYKSIMGHLQLYAALSPQKITNGRQYIRNLHGGGSATTIEGTYHVNNSELGLKLFASLSKRQVKPPLKESTTPNITFSKKMTKYRISINSQYFRPSPAIYHIPQIDSFSVKSREIAIPQIGFSLEIPFRNHNLWSSIVHLGIGYRAATLVFKSVSNFASDGFPVAREIGVNNLGIYGICNLGISRRHSLKRQVLSQSLTYSMVIPLHKESEYLGIPLSGSDFQFPPYTDPVLEGRVDYKYGRKSLLFGVEYNPEMFFNLRSNFFLAIGLVGNYSFGWITHGRFEVSNNTSTYHGEMVQNFSKLGISIRIGLEK
ncbi:MAG: hypothetical protein Q7T20_05945 [Saprospiraceae bacterium]|nr:hypothetical protein [Saprospiraceae bacterium]